MPPDTSLKALAASVKARWICEQSHQQMKEELGLAHFEARACISLHRHVLMTGIAYAFLQPLRLDRVNGGKRLAGPPPQPSLPLL